MESYVKEEVILKKKRVEEKKTITASSSSTRSRPSNSIGAAPDSAETLDSHQKNKVHNNKQVP